MGGSQLYHRRDQPTVTTDRRNACKDVGRTLQVFLDPILVYTLGQNNDPALNVPRYYGLSGGDSQVRRNLLDLERRVSELSVGPSQHGLLRSVIRGSP